MPSPLHPWHCYVYRDFWMSVTQRAMPVRAVASVWWRYVWLSHVKCIWMSHVSYKWVMSHMHESCLIWMSHVSHKWVMSHTKSHVSYGGVMSHIKTKISHMWMNHVLHEWVMSRAGSNKWVMSHIKSHVSYEGVTSHIKVMSHIKTKYLKHVNEPCLTRMSHVARRKQSQDVQ